MTTLIGLSLLLGLAVLCAAGWAYTSLRMANVERNSRIRELEYQITVERFRLAELTAGFGTWAWNPTTERFALSAGAATINGLGEQPIELTAAELYDTVHADDRATAKAVREQAFVEGGAYVHEFRRVFPDGSLRWYRNHGHVELAGKLPQRVGGAIMEITAEKQVLERLHQSAERMRLVTCCRSSRPTSSGVGAWLTPRSPGVRRSCRACR